MSETAVREESKRGVLALENDPILRFEDVDPDTGTVVEHLSFGKGNRYETGDVVATPNGKGVVTSVKTEQFNFPTGESEYQRVKGSSDSPVYVVGFGGRSAPYRASSILKSEFEDNSAPKTAGGVSLTPVISEVEVDESEIPENWTTRSLLKWWSSVGGSYTEARKWLRDQPHIKASRADSLALNYKSMILGTRKWQGNF